LFFCAAVVVVNCTLFFWASLYVFRIHENTTPLAIGEEQEGRKLAEQGASEEEMRNVVTEASLSTQASQWWAAVPSVTASIVFLCSTVYALSLVFGYDSFDQVCLSPYKLVEHFQVYRPYSSVVFHGSILHLVFNMLALVPIGSGLERLLGSVRYLHVLFLLTTSNALIQVAIAYIAAYIGTIQWYPDLLMECSIGFSGVIFAMIVIETSLSTSQTRSIFGFFTVNAKWYLPILLTGVEGNLCIRLNKIIVLVWVYAWIII